MRGVAWRWGGAGRGRGRLVGLWSERKASVGRFTPTALARYAYVAWQAARPLSHEALTELHSVTRARLEFCRMRISGRCGVLKMTCGGEGAGACGYVRGSVGRRRPMRQITRPRPGRAGQERKPALGSALGSPNQEDSGRERGWTPRITTHSEQLTCLATTFMILPLGPITETAYWASAEVEGMRSTLVTGELRNSFMPRDMDSFVSSSTNVTKPVWVVRACGGCVGGVSGSSGTSRQNRQGESCVTWGRGHGVA